MSQFRCSARLSVITLGLLLAGCGDGQQSDEVTKMKAQMGGQSAAPVATAEPDAQQARQNKLNEFLKKAERGDVLAMVEVGKAYDLGRNWGKAVEFIDPGFFIETVGSDTLLDPVRALDWYVKAVEKGSVEALGRLGVLYFRGKGVQKDLGKAFELFQKAASQGDAVAQFGLGMMYVRGEGVPKDADKFQELIRKAAEKGLADAQCEVGRWYSVGDFGVTKSDAQAVEWWKKAAEQENLFAQYFLGTAYEYGNGVPQDHFRAMQWFGASAAQGFSLSQCSLGSLYGDAKSAYADSVLAYAWSNLQAASTVLRDCGAEVRDNVARRMTPAEIAEAQRLSADWKVGMRLARESGSAGDGKQPASPGSLVKKNTGTAFIVNAAGHAITNRHVVDGCTEVRAEGRDGVVKVVTSDVVNDLAQLQIPGVPSAQATIASDPAKLRQGEDIVVFGFPLNAVLSSGGNLTPGVVSALTGLGNNTNQIQITAPIQPGSSGSPVINKKGEVVGVVAMKLSDSNMAKATGQVGQNVNFAVSGQTLRTFLDTHKVEYRSGGMFWFGGKSTADLADEARTWTLVVECWK
jgi:hypothetical protein